MNRHTRCLPLIPAVLVALGLSGCGDPAIEETSVPRQADSATAPEPAAPESSALPQPTVPMPASAPATASAGAWPWTAPESWRFVPGERPMRLATYEIADESGPVEVAVTRFPGDVGGMLANINRWRGQIGLGPITEADIPAMLTTFENPGFTGATMLLEGPQQHMLAASIHEPGADRTWFVRVTTKPETAARVREQFDAFARSFGAGG
jgi:hypothetical protein